MYRPTREESEAVIALLVKHYPGCFFEDPKLRRPLKKDITADLRGDGFPAAPELIAAALDWYTQHFGYHYALQAGVKRIGLDGKEVGTVTTLEEQKAKRYIAERKKDLQSRTTLPSGIDTTLTFLQAGKVDDALRNITPPPVKAPDPVASTSKKRTRQGYPCPGCGTPSNVVITRFPEDGVVRIRECLKCQRTFATQETVVQFAGSAAGVS
jgi:hypothetical protein